MQLNPVTNRIDPMLQRQVDQNPSQCVDFSIQHADTFDPTIVAGLTISSRGSGVTTGSGNKLTVEALKIASGVLRVSAASIMKMHRRLG